MTDHKRELGDLELHLKCESHPEKYDLLKGDEQIAHFKLRHGVFRAYVPDEDGEIIYTSYPRGDAMFFPRERHEHLSEAIKAVKAYYEERAR